MTDETCLLCDRPAVVKIVESDSEWVEMFCPRHLFSYSRIRYWRWRLEQASAPFEVTFNRGGVVHHALMLRMEKCCGGSWKALIRRDGCDQLVGLDTLRLEDDV